MKTYRKLALLLCLLVFVLRTSAQTIRVAAAAHLQSATTDLSEAAQFSQSGSSKVGIIAPSLTFSGSKRNGVQSEIPADDYPPIDQVAAMMKSSSNKVAAKAFLEFVKSERGREILSEYGLTPPNAVAQP
jgi:molybdenum ABC transporter molybdate-binding protein